LAEINNIPAPYNIYAGQTLKVPNVSTDKKTTPTSKVDNAYIVEKGDSLLLIAKKTNTKFGDLIKINDLKKPYSVYIGQKIYLNNKDGNKLNAKIKETENKNKSIEVEADTKKPTNNVVVKSANNNFMKPIQNGSIIRNFGDNSKGKFFDGIIIKGNKGDAVRVAEDGEVAYVGNELKDLGNIIIVKHKNNWLSIYGHCDTTNVKTKDIVKRGDVIASVGKTGSATDYQLYFAIRRGKVAVDPVKYLSNN
jgi:lipoprotein NlpD